MAIKVIVPRSKGFFGHFSHPVTKAAIAFVMIVATVVVAVFAFYYVRYQELIDRRMSGAVFANTAKIYAAARVVHPGEPVDRNQLATYLRHAGYAEEGDKRESKLGIFRIMRGGISVVPGPESYHRAEAVNIEIAGGKVESIVSSHQSGVLSAYELEPQLVTGLFENQQRSKRLLVSYDDIPKVMVDAVLAIEDRRFFHHSGVNYLRFAQAAFVNLRSGRHAQGGSTITMQIARGLFLTREKTYSRKLAEIIIAIELEQRFSKKRIFELYANQINMGQRGSFSIDGMGEAARAYFGKDIKNLALPEAALLAGLIQAPSLLSPYRHPEKAMARRNLVLDSMVETEAISPEQADAAKAAPLRLAPVNVEASDAPYFVDLVRDSLLQKYTEADLDGQGYRIYTSLVPELQRIAAQAVEAGMKNIDAQVAAQKQRPQSRHPQSKKRRAGEASSAMAAEAASPQPQVAMIVLDPHTGKVLALVGGRNYGMSQLNHAIARRPTGSIFKPFVYAAALNTGLSSSGPVITPATILEDAPMSFENGGGRLYQPRNYRQVYHGLVTARYALAHSLNNPTVKLAEMVGYNQVATLAKAAGIKSVKPTPAIALGSYDATPLEMAGAYTVFANGGVRISPTLINSVRDEHGEVVEVVAAPSSSVLDPRVAYVMTTMMQGVLDFGTAASLRKRGFTAPAAGKTGTSHDAWFAGYTSNLLCIVWVGNDNYSDVHLSGATSAAPIWADFMKKAITVPGYQDVRPFVQPPGVVGVQLDRLTNRLSTPSCPEVYTATFIAGTEPKETCDKSEIAAPEDTRGFFSRIFGVGKNSGEKNVPGQLEIKDPGKPPVVSNDSNGGEPGPKNTKTKKKKGFFGKFLGIFKEDKPKKRAPTPPPAEDPGTGGAADTPR